MFCFYRSHTSEKAMAVKHFSFFKVFVFLLLIFVYLSEGRVKQPRHVASDEINEIGNRSAVPTSQTASLSEYVSSGVSTVKRMIDALPSPYQVIHYGKQALIGVPEEMASEARRFLCSKVVKLNDIVKEYHPKADDLNFEYLTYDSDNVTIALSDTEYLFNHPKFRMNWNVVLFVTGWNVNASNETVTAMYDGYRCRGGYNFLVLDTSKFLDSMYAWSEFSAEPIGEIVGDAIKNLTRFVPYERIHLIGEGIGAHIAGTAGRYYTKMTGNALPRITGLDPSRPCFSEDDRPNGLQRGDALFVDIIHSNVAMMWRLDPIGDADFYPNGPSIIQHGCWSTSCTRNQAYQFYVKTIYPGMNIRSMQQN
ncbi:phospholipase A1-like, partial [Bradysia coprophila]|uniref:phospholipase A1-like n=1 Tax=Bradysia coprophila TaxID=38358 RepID=UPI00187D87E2